MARKARHGVMEFLHVFSPGMFNQIEAGINRIHSLGITDSLLYNSSGIETSLTVPGYETLNSYAASLVVPTTGTLVDRWTLTKGKHTFQAGAQMRIVHYNRNNVPGNILAYASRPAFAAAVRGEGLVPVAATDAVETAKVLDAARLSATSASRAATRWRAIGPRSAKYFMIHLPLPLAA